MQGFDVNGLKEELSFLANDIQMKSGELMRKMDKLNYARIEYDCKTKKQNPYIIKHVIKHVSNGLNINMAIDLTSDELGISTERIKIVMQTQRSYLTALNLYAKKYMAEKLKNTGLSVSEIAKLINVSQNHVYKLLNCRANLWELTGGKIC